MRVWKNVYGTKKQGTGKGSTHTSTCTDNKGGLTSKNLAFSVRVFIQKTWPEVCSCCVDGGMGEAMGQMRGQEQYT